MIGDVCSRLLGRAIVGVEQIHGGRNNQVYRVDCELIPAPHRYIAKRYFRSPDDPRDRLGTEYRALQLLSSTTAAKVPAPIAIDVGASCAIYEFVPGVRASERPASDDDVAQAIDFVAELMRLARRSNAEVASVASETFFSIDAVVDHVTARATDLRTPDSTEETAAQLQRFMTRWDGVRSAVGEWTEEQVRTYGVDCRAALPERHRTLSPSDFGFHNALRDGQGRLAFIDFEYFGWDDPAKTIADFLLHPAMELTCDQRLAFAHGVLQSCADDRELEMRARIVYPWFGLKWCLILLNEFVPQHLRRRRFAAGEGIARSERLQQQLDRAWRLLDRIDTEYRQNPYLCR